jgi:hypothetical protein
MGRKFSQIASIIVLVLCVGAFSFGTTPASAPSSQNQVRTKAKAKKPPKPQPPALPSGPTGPVQPIPLDSIAPVPPQVSYQNSQLTIVAANSTLGDILRAVRKQTGAEIEIPAAPDRVVTHLGPGSARDVLAELLNGSRFNYVLLGSPADSSVLTRVVLVAKSGPENAIPNTPNNPAITEQSQPGIVQRSGGPGAATLPDVAGDSEGADSNADDAPEAAAEPEQAPPASSDQPTVKTPQQMLQEMQQRQLQLQQQQQGQQQPPTGQPGQPPYPAQGVPPRPEDK